jgi:hypothetical protein
MLDEALVLVVGYLLPLGAFWAAVLWIRPAVARARVEREALLVRDRIMDGILAGDISPENGRAADAIEFCDYLAENSREFKFLTIAATERGFKRANFDVKARAAELRKQALADSYNFANEGGQRRLQECEEEIDHMLARYFVRGSSLWFVLAPAQRLSRFVAPLRRKVMAARSASVSSESPVPSLPGELATDLRETWRGSNIGLAASPWTVHGLSPQSGLINA